MTNVAKEELFYPKYEESNRDEKEPNNICEDAVNIENCHVITSNLLMEKEYRQHKIPYKYSLISICIHGKIIIGL